MPVTHFAQSVTAAEHFWYLPSPSQTDNVDVQIDTETNTVQQKVHFGIETPTSTLAVYS